MNFANHGRFFLCVRLFHGSFFSTWHQNERRSVSICSTLWSRHWICWVCYADLGKEIYQWRIFWLSVQHSIRESRTGLYIDFKYFNDPGMLSCRNSTVNWLIWYIWINVNYSSCQAVANFVLRSTNSRCLVLLSCLCDQFIVFFSFSAVSRCLLDAIHVAQVLSRPHRGNGALRQMVWRNKWGKIVNIDVNSPMKVDHFVLMFC